MNPHLTALGISSELITTRGLRECEEAATLELAEVEANGRDHLLVPLAAAAWRGLKAAALAEGVDLFIVSAFRSVDRQAEIVRRKLESGAALESILTVCAPPGFSEHHTGRAVDLSTFGSRALEVEFDQTAAYAWLTQHAAEFGYYLSYPIGNPWGYQYEPWHWCFQDAQPFVAGDWRIKLRQSPELERLGLMKIYGFDAQSLAIVERSECDLASALKKLEDCYVRGLTEYQSGEEAVSATTFGLYRSELDFIEVSCNGKESILVHSDRLCYPSVASKLFSLKKHLSIKGDRVAGVRTVNDYFELDREAFEQAYSRFLCR